MCGIVGFASSNFTELSLKKMTNRLQHRGPDAEGFFFNDGVGLGHRRLSILDLSTAANQPFRSQCGRYIMVYNGEVYNFRQVRDDIVKEKGIQFKTDGDTEVVLEAYALWGKCFLHQLNGMFAIAIWDREKKELFLCRDRIGIKPLYIYQSRNEIAFASELKALKTLSNSLSTNKEAVANFLYLGYIPSPSSIYNEIQKVPAGHYAVYQNSRLLIEPYWQLKECLSIKTITDFVSAKEQLHNLLIQAVQRRMIADVPLGTFLSGGVDSSIITAIAQSLSGRALKTFSIGFEDSVFDESQFARKVATHLRTEHHEFMLTEKDALKQVSTLIDVFDEPFADASAIPTLLVSALASKHVKVALSGDGGDEQFLGYGMYSWAERLANPWVRYFRKPIAAGLKLSKTQRNMRAAEVFLYPQYKNIKSHIFSQEQYFFSQPEITCLLNPELLVASKLKENYTDLKRHLSPAEEQAFFDLNYYLPDDLLVKVDRASMQHGLEVRVPLLDHELISFTLNLQHQLKKNGESKRLLKAVLYEYVPKEFFNRPKWGFNIPLAKWLKNELRYLLEDTLSDASVDQIGLVNVDQVRCLKKQFMEGRNYLYNRLWALIVLHTWTK